MRGMDVWLRSESPRIGTQEVFNYVCYQRKYANLQQLLAFPNTTWDSSLDMSDHVRLGLCIRLNQLKAKPVVVGDDSLAWTLSAAACVLAAS